jgi:hypothetical protein
MQQAGLSRSATACAVEAQRKIVTKPWVALSNRSLTAFLF